MRSQTLAVHATQNEVKMIFDGLQGRHMSFGPSIMANTSRSRLRHGLTTIQNNWPDDLVIHLVRISLVQPVRGKRKRRSDREAKIQPLQAMRISRVIRVDMSRTHSIFSSKETGGSDETPDPVIIALIVRTRLHEMMGRITHTEAL